jgi:heme A synthase
MPSKVIARIAALATVLILVILASSAYLRLSSPEGACAQDPVCAASVSSADQAGPARSIARAAHRISASVVAVLVLLVAALAWLRREGTRETRWVAVLLIALTVFLAALGAAAGGSQTPAVTWGNVLAGNAMAAAAWWLYARNRVMEPPAAATAGRNARWAIAALAVSLALFAFAAFRSAASPSVGMALTKSLAATLGLLACVWLAAGIVYRR